ncbi:MAG: hypothetical protein J6P87_05595 [Lachnospiraceae bacterium]|nr:hypothetical protein [Lachnospiraceae bacterium]
MRLDLGTENIVPVNTRVCTSVLNGESVLRVEKDGMQDIFDTNTYVLLKDIKMHNGTIRVKMLSRLLPDAPDFARGFIGIVFRVNDTGSEFESYYVRPTNGRHPDPVRRSHGSQYFSYPGYTFDYFRKHGITEYEAPCDTGLDEWTDLKAVIEDGYAEFYVNDMDTPVLCVKDLKHGKDAAGGIGLYVDTGTEAFYKDLEVESADL